MSRIRPSLSRFTVRSRGVRGVLGALAAALGASIVIRPTASLGVLAVLIGLGCVVTGVLELAAARDPQGFARSRMAMVALWVAGGIVVLVAPGLTVRAIAVAVGVGLLINGALQVVSGFSGAISRDARVASVLLGLAWIGFGALALAWPDITLIVVGIAFGARLIIGGIVTLWHAIRPPEPAPTSPDTASAATHPWRRTVAAAVALAVAVAAGTVSALIRQGSPVVDLFYAPPRDVPAQAGQLIRFEPFGRGVPEGAQAWRILYTTTDGDGDPAVASGLVVTPRDGAGDWPVINWLHGTTGFAEQCAPSLLPEPFTAGALMVLPQVIEHGWALVATDYLGLGTAGPHPYLIGVPSAQAGLDAVRAARQVSEARLGAKTVTWGHSQGGGAALWTGSLAAEYAPDVPLSGVAAMAPASDPTTLMENLGNVKGGSVFASYAVAGYTAWYPDVRGSDYIRPSAEGITRQLAGRCLSEPAMLASVLVVLGLSADPDIFARSPLEGAFGVRLQQNAPPPTVTAPLLIAQGAADSIVPRHGQDAFVTGLCDAGQQVDYRVYAGADHMPLVEPGSALIPELFAWTTARFGGKPVAKGCVHTSR